MIKPFVSATILFVVLTLVTGGLYPLLVTVVARVVFPKQAEGSLVKVDGKIIGSELIGQTFTKEGYFWSRPSAVSYNAAASSGSNLGPTNPAQLEAVTTRVKSWPQADKSPVPIDLVTASASGLDPDITPAAAYYQIERVARVRQVDESVVKQMVDESIQDRTLGLFGEKRVNVLSLNQALDAKAPLK